MDDMGSKKTVFIFVVRRVALCLQQAVQLGSGVRIEKHAKAI
jgi:hypothetical protein